MGLKLLSKDQIALISKNIIIKSRPFNKINLTTDIIEANNLLPKYCLEGLSRKIYISNPYLMDQRKEVAFVAFVEDSDKYIARTFFYSRSQGVARLLRRYKFKEIEDENHNIIEKPIWNDKGYSEESLLLPLELQKALAMVSKDKPIVMDDSYFIFYGTAYDLSINDDYLKEVSDQPLLLNGNFYSEDNHKKINPQELVFKDHNQEPDFSKAEDEWSLDFTYYGNTTARVFHSFNKELNYLFYTDENSGSWIAGIDNSSEITSLGLRKNWIKAGDLTTPPWEYLTGEVDENGKYKIDQTGGYGDTENRKDHYVDMYKNYLSKIPIIIEYEKNIH